MVVLKLREDLSRTRKAGMLPQDVFSVTSGSAKQIWRSRASGSGVVNGLRWNG